MNRHSTHKPASRKRILAGLFVPLFVGGAVAAPAAGPAASGAAYNVINLAPDYLLAYLNERGQAAVGSRFATAAFFDGERLLPLRTPGSGERYTFVRGLNNHGVVTGESHDLGPQRGDPYPFTWTAARGTRVLPGPTLGQVNDINDRNQVVGQIPEANSIRAVRWDPNGALVRLGPPPTPFSATAFTINNSSVAGGYTSLPDFSRHATLWNAAGAQIDLGNLGGGGAYTLEVNERGEAAGYAGGGIFANQVGFFWSRASGVVPIPAQNGISPRVVADLNDRGEVVGVTVPQPTAPTAYRWSRARGLAALPRAGAEESDVFDINNRSEMVGALRRGPNWRAVLWRGLATPVDLNSRLNRIPTGLVLQRAVAINEAGTILAESNAGLVMLRPGKGTGAPVLGPVTGLPENVTVGDEVRGSVSFIDNAPRQVHTAAADWGESCASPLPLVTEAGGRGTVTFQHRFCTPGLHTLVLRVTDSGGLTTETRRNIFVSSAGLAAVGGQGTLAGAAGAQPLQFSLWAPFGEARGDAGAQAARAQVAFEGPFVFRSERVEAVRKGAQLRIEGAGIYNGRPDYRFVVDAVDGATAQGGADRMRVRISHRDAGGAEVVDYDSAGHAQAGTASVAAAAEGMRNVEGALVLSD